MMRIPVSIFVEAKLRQFKFMREHEYRKSLFTFRESIMVNLIEVTDDKKKLRDNEKPNLM